MHCSMKSLAVKSNVTFDVEMVDATFYRWKIPNFAERRARAAFQDQWASARFGVAGMAGVLFSLAFFPKGNREDLKDHVRAALKLRATGGRPVLHVHFDLWLEGVDGFERFRVAGTDCTFDEICAWGWSKFAPQEEVFRLAEEGAFFLCCRVEPLAPLDRLEFAAANPECVSALWKRARL
ncbi:hypothetical protein M3Y99_01486700 [Aphelenchoides fujianensis]|nr:hypothetical protein M3Y99_01486700 [Aphelenchoides fujianensis]